MKAFSSNCLSVWILSSSLSPEQESLNYWAVLNGTGQDRIVLLFDDYKHTGRRASSRWQHGEWYYLQSPGEQQQTMSRWPNILNKWIIYIARTIRNYTTPKSYSDFLPHPNPMGMTWGWAKCISLCPLGDYSKSSFTRASSMNMLTLRYMQIYDSWPHESRWPPY